MYVLHEYVHSLCLIQHLLLFSFYLNLKLLGVYISYKMSILRTKIYILHFLEVIKPIPPFPKHIHVHAELREMYIQTQYIFIHI